MDSKGIGRGVLLVGVSAILLSLGADVFGLGGGSIQLGVGRWALLALGCGLVVAELLHLSIGIPAVQRANEYVARLVPSSPISVRPALPHALLTLACIATIVWQSTFALAADKLDRTYMNRAASGAFLTSPFVYFYYYKNLFPIVSGVTPPEYNRQAADDLIRHRPETLLMELRWTVRSGDNGKVLIYLPEAILRGTPEGAGMTWFLSWFFTLSLVCLLIASYYAGVFPLGILLVAFLGSHPFQLAEVYNKGLAAKWAGATWSASQGQVFSIPISLTTILLAMHFPLIFDQRVSKYYLWGLPIVSGGLVAAARQVRGENSAAILSLLLCYALASSLTWRRKIAMGLLAVLSFLVCTRGWNAYFDHKFAEAYQVVKSAGGHPLPNEERLQYHPFWSTVWAGLGDFGTSKGYAWDDDVLYAYACPLLEARGALAGRPCRDLSQTYAQVPWTIPGFEAISRDKVLGDIAADPGWYADILLKRIQRILTAVAPARLGIGAHYRDFPVTGALLVPLLLILVIVRRWSYLRLLVFSLPLALGALVVYSGKGMTYYSIFLQVGMALCGIALWNALAHVYRVFAPRLRQSVGTRKER